MNRLDTTLLSSNEYKLYSESKLRFERALQELYDLSKLPPFAFDKNGQPSELLGEFIEDITAELAELDEENFITDRYKPFANVHDKYRNEIAAARAVASSSPTLGGAIQKWFDDNGLIMTPSTAYRYNVER